MAGPGRRAGAAGFNGDGSSLFVAYDDGSIRQYDAKYGTQRGQPIATGPAPIHALAVSSDGQVLAIAVPAADPATPGDLVLQQHLRSYRSFECNARQEDRQ